VRQHPPDGQVTVRLHRQVPRDRVVELQQPLVAALHHQHRGERLGDRADPQLAARVDVGADRERPQRPVGAVDGHAQRRHPRVGLDLPGEPLVPFQRRHASSLRSGRMTDRSADDRPETLRWPVMRPHSVPGA
jgi:hypothetical protein